MRAQFYVLTLFLGVVLTVHLAMNGKVGAALNNPPVANALFWCIGAITAVIIGLTGWQSGALSGLGAGESPHAHGRRDGCVPRLRHRVAHPAGAAPVHSS